MNEDFEMTNTIDPVDYLEMRKAVGFGSFPVEQAAEGLRNSIMWCIRDKNQPVAFGRIITDYGYVVYVADIMVLPQYQGRGLGRTIMENIMQHIRSMIKPGYRIMAVLVAAHGKEKFYEKFGFIKRPNESFGPGMHQWLETSFRL
ncbi:MAG: GNAT family N-acetyltransferase [Treponema sp.]|nr:GNAT family N-acetyltransferase [Treponema sp.]